MIRAPQALALLCLAAAPALGQGPYHVEVLPIPAGAPQAFPTCMGENAVIGGYQAPESFDPSAVPLVSLGTSTRKLRSPTQSLNFVLGCASARLLVGSSSNLPYAWVDGQPRLLEPVAGLLQGNANGANAAHAICGTLVNDFTGDQLPVRWAGPGLPGSALSVAPGSGGTALAINASGAVAGAVVGGGFAFVGARWDKPGLPPALVGVLAGADNSELRAINAQGDTAGRSGFPDFTIRALMHQKAENRLVALGTLGGTYSEALGIDSGRRVVGVSTTARGELHAFLWQDGAMHDLNDLIHSASTPITAATSAVAIDDEGRIAVQVLVPGGPGSSGDVSRMARFVPIGP